MAEPNQLEATWHHAVSVLWLIVWRSVGGGFIFGAFSGIAIGLIVYGSGATEATAQIVCLLVGGIVAVIWTISVLRQALAKTYGDFRIALVAVEPRPSFIGTCVRSSADTVKHARDAVLGTESD